MRKITLLLTIFISIIFVNAEVLLTETFDYTAGTDLSTINGWTTTGTLTTGSGRLIEVTPLTYSNSGGEYILSGTGKALNNNYQAGSNYIAYKSFEAVNSGTVYLSFLYKVYGDQGQSNSEIIGMSDRTTNSNVKAWAGKGAGGSKNPFRLGVTRISTTGSDIQYGAETMAVNSVYLIVIKYDFTDDPSNAKASLFINPEIASATEPGTPYAYDDSKGTARSALNYLMFKHNGSSIANFIVGGIRISTTWEEAVAKKITGLPQLSTPIVGTASNERAESFTANWTAVSGAVGYDVRVYEGANNIGTYSVDGEMANSLKINGLNFSTAYTYTVTAKGDWINAENSDESEFSEEVMTAAALTFIDTDFNDEIIWGSPEIIPDGKKIADICATYYLNDYYLQNAVFNNGNLTCEDDGSDNHVNRIAIVKGSLTLPFVQSAKKLELHVSVGTENNGITKLEESTNGSTWTQTGTSYINAEKNKDYVYTIPLTNTTLPVKIRISNSTGSAVYIWKIKTITDDTPTSIETINTANTLYAINNTIYSSQAGVLEIYSLSGAKLSQAAISSSYECNLSSGIYIVCLKAENGKQYFQKVRIQ